MKVSGPMNLPQVQDAGPAQVRRSGEDPASAGYAAAARVSGEGAQAVARGLQALSAGLDKMAEDRDRAKAAAAINDYMSRSSTLLYDPKSGLMLASGAGAEGLSAKAYKSHKELQGEIGSKLNGRQRRLFQEGIAPYDRSVGQNVMRHEGEAMAKYRSDEGQKLIANTAALIARAPDNISLEAQEETVYQAAQGIYGPNATMDDIRNVRQDMLGQAVLLIAQSDPIKAQELLKRESGSFEPAALQALSSEVEKAAVPMIAKKIYAASKGSLEDGVRYIEKNVEPGKQEAYKSAYRSVWASEKQIESARQDENNKKLVKLYMTTKSLNGANLGQLVSSGAISEEQGLYWTNVLKADEERKIAAAERAAARADRAIYQKERLFNLSLNRMNEYQQELAKAKFYRNLSPEYFEKNFKEALAKAQKGQLKDEDIIWLDAYGMVVPTQLNIIKVAANNANSFEGKRYNLEYNRVVRDVTKMLDIPGIPFDVKGEIMQTLDSEIGMGGRAVGDILPDAMGIVKERLGRDDMKTSTLGYSYFPGEIKKLSGNIDKVLSKKDGKTVPSSSVKPGTPAASFNESYSSSQHISKGSGKPSSSQNKKTVINGKTVDDVLGGTLK